MSPALACGVEFEDIHVFNADEGQMYKHILHWFSIVSSILDTVSPQIRQACFNSTCACRWLMCCV